MGYPLSTFQQLAWYCRENRFDSTFDRYKIVAIPFISPQDRVVRDTLKYNFERLHVSTRKDFAFFAFMAPPLRWQQEHPSWMNVRNQLPEGLSTDEERVVTAMRERFSLPSSPVLLLTNSLRSTQYVVIPVDENDLVQKMEAVGAFAEQTPERFPITDPSFEKFLSQYDSVFVERTENGESIARNITDILAVDSLLYNTGEYRQAWGMVRRDAGDWVRNVLSNLSYKAYSAPDDQFEKLLKRYSDYLALTLETIDPKIEVRDAIDYSFDMTSYMTPHSISLNEEPCPVMYSDQFLLPDSIARYLTRESKRKKESYNKLVPFFMREFDHDKRRYPSYIPSPSDDLSPLGLYLGHIMEEELNASVVQLSRKNAGIEMPKYYRIWDKTHSRIPVISNENGSIYLNCRKDRLKGGKFSVNTLTIGQVALTIRKMMEANPELSFGSFGQDAFLSRIDRFVPFRNRAAHSGRRYDFEFFKTAHQSFSSIMETDFPRMAALKRDLSH